MHEHKVFEEIRQKEKEFEGKKLILEIGELYNISEKEIKKEFPHLPTEVITAEVRCLNCGSCGRPNIVERDHDLVIFECNYCGSSSVKAVKGTEFNIKISD